VQHFRHLTALAILHQFFFGQAFADVKVVTSIKPIHSLVSAVMEGAGEPQLLVSGNATPHTFQLRPSDAEKLQEAQLVFWVGHELENFLEKPLETLSGKASTVSLIDIRGLQTLAVREGDGFAAQDDHSVESEEHNEERDAHIWLDPKNAQIIVSAIRDELTRTDNENAKLYAANAEKLLVKLNALNNEMAAEMMDLRGLRFITFHDAYQYFEHRYGLSSAGTILIHPENPPGAAGIRQIHDRITSGQINCVFAEPQFDNKLVSVVTEGTVAKIGELDPIGATLEPGPGLYEILIRKIAQSFKTCLS
jgi:zinc transport system substrate-binding protein